jgi:hypothetical protein
MEHPSGARIRAERERRRIINADPEGFGTWEHSTHRARTRMLLRWALLYRRWSKIPEKAYGKGEESTARRAQLLASAAESMRAAARALSLVSWAEPPPEWELELRESFPG